MNPLDSSNMYRMIEDYPLQFAKGFELASHLNLHRPVEKVVLTGMGGSALCADLVNMAFTDDLKSPILICRNYFIPYSLDEKTLVIVSSFSGNTEETISAYSQAVSAGAQVVIMTSGGQLLEIAFRDAIEYIKLTKESDNFQPRMSTGYSFAVVASVMMQIGWLPESVERQVVDMSHQLQEINTEGKGRQLGESLVNTIPTIYVSDSYWPIARITKIKLNENSKIPAFWNDLPELNHNEMIGFTNTKDNYRVVMLRDPDDDPRINQRMETTADVLRSQGIGLKATIWDMEGESRLLKIFSTLMIMDWASYFLALANGVDPTPVKMVEDFKALIK